MMGLSEAVLAAGLLTTAYVLLFLNIRTFVHFMLVPVHIFHQRGCRALWQVE
jgi:hypothetical protein